MVWRDRRTGSPSHCTVGPTLCRGGVNESVVTLVVYKQAITCGGGGEGE